MNHPVYIFDADGVLNSLTHHEADVRVLNQITELLNKGCYIAINTGRAYEWVKENVIDSLRKLVTTDKLDQIFVSTEMGGLTVEFMNGIEHDSRTAFSLSPEQIQKVKQFYDDHVQTKDTLWYQGKASMATIYKPGGVEVDAFHADAQKFGVRLRELFADAHVKVQVNPDAIDVTAPEAGKWAGAQLIHDWLQRTPAAAVQHFICFGDNTSDYEMARFFGRQGHTVEFVYTGQALGDVEHDPQVTLTTPSVPYSDGTYEFLHNLKS